MTQSASTTPQPPSQWLPWAMLVAGVGAAIGWVLFGQKLGETILITNVGAATAVYYMLLFVPLIALAALLGMFGGQNVFRRGDAPGRWVGIGVALGCGGLFAALALAWLNGGVARGTLGGAGIAALLLGAGLTLLQVAAEEVFFRGWLQPALVGRIGVWPGILGAATVFALFHLSAGALGALSLVNVLLGGLWFGLLAQRSGGILAPLAAHFAWNVIEDLGLGLTPNPGNGPLGSIIDLDLVGSVWWGGRVDGLNASIGTTAVLLALILPIMTITKENGKPRPVQS